MIGFLPGSNIHTSDEFELTEEQDALLSFFLPAPGTVGEASSRRAALMETGERLTEALVAFGANVGDCRQAMEKSLELLREDPGVGEISAAQPIVTSAATGDRSGSQQQADYLNSAFLVRTSLDPRNLHQLLIRVEEQLGRERLERWGPRSVDLDLILFADVIVDEKDLQVPHPRMSFRRFVLAPATEVAAEMVDPRSGMTVSQLLQHLDSKEPRILIATNQSQFAAELIEVLDQNEYELVVVDNEAEFVRHAADAKLLVSWSNPAESSPLERYAKNFAGPRLVLDGKSVAESARELTAAMQAMGPILCLP